MEFVHSWEGGYKDNDAVVQYGEDKIVKKVDVPY
jgi:hypothetical protein